MFVNFAKKNLMLTITYTIRYIFWALSLGFAALLGAGCATQSVTPAEERAPYASYTGSETVRGQIKESFNSVKRLQNSVVYRHFVFDRDSLPTKAELEGVDIRRMATDSYIDDHSNAGTAIVMSTGRRGAAILTASHVVTYPDTIWHYHSESMSGINALIEGVSIKQSTSHFIIDEATFIGFEIIANDPRRDLALLVETSSSNENQKMTPLKIEPGSHSTLDWTDLVYAVGYPRGIQMVTSAMVSNYQISPRRSYILDASFNRGFSGGAIFSVKSDGSGLEWVGVLSAAYAEPEYYLAPAEIDEDDLNLSLEYRGAIFIERAARVNYGITYAVGMNEVRDFFREVQSQTRRHSVFLPVIPD